MKRSGFMVLCGALGVAGALGGCFDKGVFAAHEGGGGDGASQGGTDGTGGGMGGVGGTGGGTGGAGGATTTSSAGGAEPCEACYEGPANTLGHGECKEGCRKNGVCEDQVVPRAEGCTTTENDESCDGEPRCLGTPEWSLKLGGSGEQNGLGITFDAAGNILVAGAFTGNMDFATSQGANDGFVVKLAPDKTRVWPKAFGGNGTDRCTRVALDKSGGVILAGTFETTLYIDGTSLQSESSSDVFVAKLDGNGNLDWINRFNGPSVDRAYGLAVDFEDNIIVAGSFTDRLDVLTARLRGGGEEMFVAKLDTHGDLVWAHSFGDSDAQAALDAAVTPEGDVVVVGRIAGTVAFGTTSLDARGTDAFIAKLDSDGTPQWAKTFGDNMEQEFAAVAVDKQTKRIVVAGSTKGTIDFDGAPRTYAGGADAVVAAFEANGKHVWNRQYGDSQDQKVLGAAVDQAGNVLVVGEFAGTINFSPRLQSRGNTDAFLAKLDPNGDTAWAKSFGDGSPQSATAVAVGELGIIALTGNFSGSIDLGDTPLTSNPQDREAFVAKLQP